MTKIYISSTYSDLVEHRQRVYDILRKMRYDVIAMEDYVATDQRPLDKCLADVASCHVYVGIFAWRYGYVPPGRERSITELEYRQAGHSGLERLIFLLDEEALWPRKYMDEVTGEGEKGEKIKALRQELKTAHTVQFFKSPEELAGQVAASVAQWAQVQLDADMDLLRARRDQADRERREKRARQRVVNLRPLDVAHFKDRLREIQALCDHLAEASVRLVSVVGRAGMGKTALVSRVLADLERGKLPIAGEERELPIDGILYLSARSTGLGLERIYADTGRMLGEPAASQLAARWADRDARPAAKVEYLLETMQDGLYLILLDMLEDYLTEEGAIAEEGLRLLVERCLTQPDGVQLVATSREEVRLATAALHSARCIPLREGLPEDDAIYYAVVRDIRMVSRTDLFPDTPRNHPKANRRYYQLLLGDLQPLPQPIVSRRLRRIVFIPTTLIKFEAAVEINDLWDESPLEDRLWAVFKQARIRAERQYPIEIKERTYFLDFAIFCNEGKIDVETDGDAWHIGPEPAQVDRQRGNNLASRGWQVLRFNTTEIHERPVDYCVSQVMDTINELGGLDYTTGVPVRYDPSNPLGPQQLGLFD